MKRPIGSDDVQREYLHSQLNSLKYFLTKILIFTSITVQEQRI